jgi:hypothetical protein
VEEAWGGGWDHRGRGGLSWDGEERGGEDRGDYEYYNLSPQDRAMNKYLEKHPKPRNVGQSASRLMELPPAFRDTHEEFHAPFGTEEWRKLVDWKRRMMNRFRKEYNDDDRQLLNGYIEWANAFISKYPEYL